MNEAQVQKLLEERRVRPSAQRVAIAKHVLCTKEHPTAEQVWRKVKADYPFVSRATVYNTLNLFVKKGLLRRYELSDAGSVFDPNCTKHHHLVDEESGKIVDIPWERLEVAGLDSLKDIEITEYMVLVRGRRKRERGARRKRRKEEEP
jgi:Fe2+ or Zn2+ uptake regulation protein